MMAADRVPAPIRRALTSPVLLVLGAVVSVQVGAGVAKSGFEAAGATGLVFLRLGIAAVILVVLVRPRLRGHSARAWRTVVAYATALAVMNWAFYQAFARIELGIAVTIEFLGPLAVAVLGSRRVRDVGWALLAGLGVAALGLGPTELDPAGVGFALLAAAAWAAYILTSAGTGRHWEGLDGLAVASTLAALMVVPPLLLPAGSAGLPAGSTFLDLFTPTVLLAGAGAALLSSVIPYALELRALRSLPPRTFGVLLSLEPAVAAAVGVVLLSERLELLGWVAIAAVVAASIGATRSRAETRRPRDQAAADDAHARLA
ncbi:EamA family transporter [Nocardioidaceae bacterium]|nr:EamA family transporter [Nocardioidaceae bacterium]